MKKEKVKLFGNKCLCGGKWIIRGNNVIGEFYCDKCNEFKRVLSDEEYLKYKKLIKKKIKELKETISK